jgi:pimeloyl-ACP methyl ester carboxylesterase
MRKVRGSPIWKGPTRSLQPLALAPNVRTNAVVRLVVGQSDETASPEYSMRYAQALKKRGIDAQVTVVPTLGHNILLTLPALDALAEVLRVE